MKPLAELQGMKSDSFFEHNPMRGALSCALCTGHHPLRYALSYAL
jgi:hypothetical protein